MKMVYYVIIAKNDVNVGQDLDDAVLEELGQKGSGEIDCKRAIVLERVLGDSLDRRRTNGEEEAAHVVNLRLFHIGPVLRIVQMVLGERVGGAQMCHERSVVARAQHSAGARRHLVIHLVDGFEAHFGRLGSHYLGVGVLANAAHERGRVGLLENPAGCSQAILGRAARRVLDFGQSVRVYVLISLFFAHQK